MEKREELGESSVEKVVRDEAKDAERKSKRRAEAERRRDESAKSLFDFINVKLRGGDKGINIDPNHGKRKSKNGFSNNKQTEKVPLNEESSKNLKIRQFELGERITRIEREISKYKESHARLKSKDPKSAATVQAKLEAKEVELRRLRPRYTMCSSPTARVRPAGWRLSCGRSWSAPPPPPAPPTPAVSTPGTSCPACPSWTRS